jgi:hypothetical protein
MAASAGVDIVNIYQPASWHGYQPKGNKLIAYYETILKEVKHEVALAPNPVIGTGPTPQMVADLFKRFRKSSPSIWLARTRVISCS